MVSSGLYDPTQLAGNMHLSEAEIRLSLQMDNDLCRFDVLFDSIKSSDTLVLVGDEPREDQQPLTCKLRLFNIEGGVTTVDDWEAGTMGVGEVSESFYERPHCKMFEAVILERQRYSRAPGEEVFGLLFPDGHAILVDSGPEDTHTHRRILAMIALRNEDTARG